MLHVKLCQLERWNEARRDHAYAYDQALAHLAGVDPVAIAPQARSVYHQYVVRVADRGSAIEALRERGVATGVHYPIPLHHQPALAQLHSCMALPAAERLAETVLSIPVYPELTSDQREAVSDALAAYARQGSGLLVRGLR